MLTVPCVKWTQMIIEDKKQFCNTFKVIFLFLYLGINQLLANHQL